MPPEDRSGLEAAVDRAASIPGHEQLKAVIAKELLHYDMLDVLRLDGHLEGKSFIGGTAIRLAFGGERFSEDLDFAAGPDFDGTEATGITPSLHRAVSERYGLDVGVRERLKPFTSDRGAVSSWTVLVDTTPGRPDVPSVKVKLDVSNIPSYTGRPHEIRANYEDVAPEHRGMRIVTQTASEIAADKVVSTIATFDRNHPRFRDLWDLTHLALRGARPDPAHVRQKRIDHGDFGNELSFAVRCDAFLDRLSEMVHDPRFAGEMMRFLPKGIHAASLRSSEGLQVIENRVRDQVRHVIR